MHRLAFSKADTAKFISHLDLMRTFQRSFLRAGIAIKHTEGFNPHAFVSIPLPLSVGFSSSCEVLECQVLDTPLDQVPARMNAALPAGITVQRCYEGTRPVKELGFVNYIVTMEYEAGAPYGTETAIRDLLAQKSLVMEKRSKKAKSGKVEVDLIPLIRQATVEERRDTIALDLILKAQNPGLNPELIMAAIRQHCPDASPDYVSYPRRAVLDENLQPWEYQASSGGAPGAPPRFSTPSRLPQNVLQQVVHLGIGQHRLPDAQVAGQKELFADGAGVVEQDEVGAVFPGHVGKVVGAQLVGEKDRGSPLLQHGAQRLPGQGGALAVGGGEKKVFRHPLHRQHHPALAVLIQRIPEPLTERAAGQGGGDQHPGPGGVGAVALGHVEGPPPLLEQLLQLPEDLDQQREGAALKVAQHPGKAPGGALPQHLLAKRARFSPAVEAGAVHRHHPAPDGDGQAGPEQVGSAPDAVGGMSHRQPEAEGRPAVSRRRGEE